MRQRKPTSIIHSLRKTKAVLLAVGLTLAGILLIMLNGWIAPMDLGAWDWLHALPIGELGGTLFGAGLLSTLFEYTFSRGCQMVCVSGRSDLKEIDYDHDEEREAGQ